MKRIILDLAAFKKVKNSSKFSIFFLPEFWAVINHRFKSLLYKKKIPILSSVIKASYWLIDLLITTITGVQISPNAAIGGGLYLPHRGEIVINGNSVIGNDCTIFHGVTIGRGGGRDRFLGSATIGDSVYIGAGAKIIGEITIGDYVTIGANAVVTKDIPSATLAVGNPARIIFPPESWEPKTNSSFFILDGWRNGNKKVIALYNKGATSILVKLFLTNLVQLYINSFYIKEIEDSVETISIPKAIDTSKPIIIELVSIKAFDVFKIDLQK